MNEVTRETLELAALAAGIKADQSKRNGGPPRNDGFDIAGNLVTDWHSGTVWRPHLDGGDAARLAVRLQIDVAFGHHITHKVYASRSAVFPPCPVSVAHDGTESGRVSAWHEAVLLCAAEVGRRMRGER